jgi:hypothetical protein
MARLEVRIVFLRGANIMRLEGFVVEGPAQGDLQPGDHILVDWSRRPEKGALGAVREHGNGVRIEVFNGDDSSPPPGRLVNPAILLKR